MCFSLMQSNSLEQAFVKAHLFFKIVAAETLEKPTNPFSKKIVLQTGRLEKGLVDCELKLKERIQNTHAKG